RRPGFGNTDEHRFGASSPQCSDGFLTDSATAVGDEHPPELRIGGHFPPLPVVGHIGSLPLGAGKGHGLAALVELKRHADWCALDTVGMEMRHDRRTTVHLDEAD